MKLNFSCSISHNWPFGIENPISLNLIHSLSLAVISLWTSQKWNKQEQTGDQLSWCYSLIYNHLPKLKPTQKSQIHKQKKVDK